MVRRGMGGGGGGGGGGREFGVGWGAGGWVGVGVALDEGGVPAVATKGRDVSADKGCILALSAPRKGFVAGRLFRTLWDVVWECVAHSLSGWSGTGRKAACRQDEVAVSRCSLCREAVTCRGGGAGGEVGRWRALAIVVVGGVWRGVAGGKPRAGRCRKSRPGGGRSGHWGSRTSDQWDYFLAVRAGGG